MSLQKIQIPTPKLMQYVFINKRLLCPVKILLRWALPAKHMGLISEIWHSDRKPRRRKRALQIEFTIFVISKTFLHPIYPSLQEMSSRYSSRVIFNVSNSLPTLITGSRPCIQTYSTHEGYGYKTTKTYRVVKILWRNYYVIIWSGLVFTWVSLYKGGQVVIWPRTWQ